MALLTAEDVLNKAFSKTKYREGFDQDEVDDFLDEVASTIAALTAERDELQSRLSQAGSGAPVAAAPAAPATGLLAAATDPNPPSATTMLAMAQKLHDDYVQAGEAERERIVGEAKSKAEQIVEQAERDARDRMGALDGERAELERRIDDLRRFERDYRSHLRNYLENLLGDLEHSATKPAATAPVDAVVEPVATVTEPTVAPLAAPALSAPVQASEPEGRAPYSAPPVAPVNPAPSVPAIPVDAAAAFAEFAAAPSAPAAPATPSEPVALPETFSPYGTDSAEIKSPFSFQEPPAVEEPPRWNS